MEGFPGPFSEFSLLHTPTDFLSFDQRDVVHLGRQIAPLYMSPNTGGRGEGVAGSQSMSTSVYLEPK
jgi:hypothetical protein